jgi:hypothetical protein
MARWLIDPEHAPSGRDLAEALRTITADVTSGNHSDKVRARDAAHRRS